MITFKSQLNKKEKSQVNLIMQEVSDSYCDFYVTKNNIRLFIKENSDVLFESLKKGDKIVISDNAIAFFHGWSDKSNRNYIKILSEDQQETSGLIKVALWHLGHKDLFAKVKKNNPAKAILENNGWVFKGNRGKEVLLYRKGIKSQKTVKEK